MTLFTYILIVQSLAMFPDIELSRTWLHTPGLFHSLEECQDARTREPETSQYSQCMPYFQAEAIVRPYNQGAFVLQQNKEKS